jgi:competence protein ComEC
VFAYPLFFFSLAFLAGIVLASRNLLPWEGWLALSLGTGLAWGGLHRYRSSQKAQSEDEPGGQAAPGGAGSRRAAAAASFLFLLLLFLSLGGLRYELARPRVDAYHIAWYADRQYALILTARLVQPAEMRDTYTLLRAQVESVDTGDEVLPARGLILVRLPGQQFFEYGDLLRLRGRLETPPEGELFSYRDYLARQGIQAYMRDAEVTYLAGGGNPILRLTFELRHFSRRLLHRFYPDPQASLLAGILLGDEGGLTEAWQRAFKVTGTSHIIAISGFNIAIIVGIFTASFGRIFGARRGAILAIFGVILYTIMVGAMASVVRAAIMGTLGILAQQLYRRQVGLNTLTFTAALMALFSPFVLWDVGFQLSFFATLGLILFGSVFQEGAERWLKRLGVPAVFLSPGVQFLSDAVLLTLAAQLTTLPIMAYHFQQISLIAFLANPFILPVQPAVMILGGLSVILGWISGSLGQWMAWIAWPFVTYTLTMVDFFSRFPHSVLELGRVPLWSLMAWYAALAFWSLERTRREKVRAMIERWVPLSLALTALIVLLVAVLLWRAVFSLPDGRLHLTFLNVGSADAVLIRTPAGRWVLINGGPSANTLSEALGRRFSPFEHELDWLIVASTQQDQVAGLPWVLERYPPRAVLWAGLPQASAASQALDGWLTERSIPVAFAEAGQVLDLGQGAQIEVIASGRRGAVLLVRWGAFRALLPIGMDAEMLESLQKDPRLRSLSVFSLPNSGYPALLSQAWLEQLAPELVVLSVAADDPYGNPTPEVLKMLRPYSLLRTDLAGWIEVSTDGKQMWVFSEREVSLPPPPSRQRDPDRMW